MYVMVSEYVRKWGFLCMCVCEKLNVYISNHHLRGGTAAKPFVSFS